MPPAVSTSSNELWTDGGIMDWACGGMGRVCSKVVLVVEDAWTRPPWIRLAGTCGLGSASVFGFLFTSLYIGINTVSITTTTNACPTPTIRLCLPAHHVTLHCGASLSGDGDKWRPLIARLAVRTCECEHENNNENKRENNSNRSSMSLNRYFLCT